jgi:hypothetical protein
MTTRASKYVAAIAGLLALFAMGAAHADTRLGVALKAVAPKGNTVTKVAFFGERDCEEPHSYKHKRCHERKRRHCHERRDAKEHCHYKRKRRHVRRRSKQVHHHHHHYYPVPYPAPNYEIYTYRPPYEVAPRMDIQAVYGWYDGYYYAYPYYPGADY